jgi:hypothetical protein
MSLLLSVPIWLSPIGLGALFASRAQRAKLDVPSLAATVLAFGVYVAALFGGQALPLHALFGPFHWNWAGKVLAILSTLAMVAVLIRVDPRHTLAGLGLTRAQAPGSLGPSLAAIALLTLLSLVVALLEPGHDFSLERLAYQTFMPSIDEELFLRGLLLGLLSVGLGGRSVSVLGAPISLACVVLTCVFALPHGLSIQADGGLDVSLIALAFTFIAGGVMVWLRQRTGSVLLPMLAHTLGNLAASF